MGEKVFDGFFFVCSFSFGQYGISELGASFKRSNSQKFQGIKCINYGAILSFTK